MSGSLSLPKTRYLLRSLLLRAESDTVRRSMPALLVALFAALRDRDTIYGWDFRRTAEAMGIDEVLTAPCIITTNVARPDLTFGATDRTIPTRRGRPWTGPISA